jgi:hypothetical protein
MLFRDDVIDLVRGEAEQLGNPAAFASTFGTLMDLPPQARRDEGPTHDWWSCWAARILALRTKCSMY